MTTWKDGGDYGRTSREIVSEDESHVIARVITKHYASYRPALNPTRPWPEGEANFALILQAPQMLEALEEMLLAMSAVFVEIRRQETVESQLGTIVTRQAERAMALTQAVIATVRGGNNSEDELV